MRVIAVFAVLAVCAGVAGVMADKAAEAPRFVVNLDEPALTRWSEVVSHFQDDYAPVIEYIDSLLGPKLVKLLDPIFADVDKYIPQPYADELRGVAAAGSKVGLDLGRVVAMNLIYDLSAGCTSIVTPGLVDASTKAMFHSRNLDYPITGLRNLTVQVEFQSKNKTMYHCTTFAGYVGCLTGMRPGVLSLTVDERDKGGSRIDNLVAAIVSALEGAKSLGFFLRDSLQNAVSFDDTVHSFESQRLMAPVYIIVAGAKDGEGVVVTRDRNASVDNWFFNESNYKWFLVETNYDHWQPAPARDDRRDVAIKALNDMGEGNVSNDNLFNVLSTPPVFNDGTKYTAQMIPATGYINTYVRYDAPSDVRYVDRWQQP